MTWRDRTQVQRVEFYTRWTLVVMMWGLPAFFVLTLIANAEDQSTNAIVVVLTLSVVTLATCTRVLLRALDIYPDPGPVERSLWLPMAASVVAVYAVMAIIGPTPVTAIGAWVSGVATVWTAAALTDRTLWVPPMLVVPFVSWLVVGGGNGAAIYIVGMTLFFFFTVRTSMWILGVVRELDRAREAQSRLAVAEERLRFARDVHDVVGRHLGAISVKTDLASTLVSRGRGDAAVEQLGEVQSLAHQALREARELARGYRAPDLLQEIAGARSLLQAAGIRPVIALDGLPPDWAEPVAWVVREGVTNALRHASPEQVEITYSDRVVTVRNDGVSTPTTGGDGHGIVGLRERLAPWGADLTTRCDGDSFALSIALPQEA